MELFIRFLNYCISFVASITAIAVVVFMLVTFINGVYNIAIQLADSLFLKTGERQELFNLLGTEFLYTIAILVILMKAYRILVEYVRTHQVEIKYIVEIAIIGCVFELLFNYSRYSEDMRLVLLGLAVTFLGFYAFKYDTLQKAVQDTEKQMKKMKS